MQVLRWGDATPKLGDGVGLGVKIGPIRLCDIGFLLAPHSDQSAISNRLHRTQQRYRRTDGQTDGIGIAIVDLMLRATRWHRSQKSAARRGRGVASEIGIKLRLTAVYQFCQQRIVYKK